MLFWSRVWKSRLGSVGRPVAPLDTITLRFRVLPSETLYGVLINSRYLDFIELGRIEWITRVGMARLAKKNSWLPLATSQGIVYKRPLRLFDAVELKTRICSWDERALHLEHFLLKDGRIHASAVSKASIVGKNGIVPPAEVLRALGVDAPSSGVSNAIAKWSEAESTLQRLRFADEAVAKPSRTFASFAERLANIPRGMWSPARAVRQGKKYPDTFYLSRNWFFRR